MKVKAGDIVQKLNPWKKHNAWLDFDSDNEPILVLRVELGCGTLYRMRCVSLRTNRQFWDKCNDYEVISESR